MVPELLWIVGVYLFGAVAVHSAERISRRSPVSRVIRYVLHTRDDGRHIEWALRSLLANTRLRGQPMSISVVDEGSTDETFDIVHMMSRQQAIEPIETSRISGPDALRIHNVNVYDTNAIHIRLYCPEDWLKLPYHYSVK